MSESVTLIQHIIGFDSKYQKIAYSDRLETVFLNNFKRAFSTTLVKGGDSNSNLKTFILTQEESNLIKNKLLEFEKPYWKQNLFPNSTLIPLDTLNAILDDKRRGWEYFHKKYGDLFCQFTDPIFLRSGTICIVQIYYKSEERKGRHELSILKKVNGKWEQILAIFGGSW
jgi:hypothetical protein